MRFVGPAGWVIDTDVAENPREYREPEYANSTSRAPKGHIHRCQDEVRHTFPKRQCTHFVVPGTMQCRFHGVGNQYDHLSRYEVKEGSGFFRRLSQNNNVRALLDDAQKRSPEERLSLLEEVELTRAAAGEALRVFEKALDDGNQNKVLVAADLMRQSMIDVAHMVQRATQTRAQNEQTVSAENLEFIVAHIEKILHDVLGEQDAIMVIDRIKAIRLPSKVSNEHAQEMADKIREAMDHADETQNVVEEVEDASS